MEHESRNENQFVRWLKRFGFWGFMFFFIKGLLWLIIPALIAYFAS